LEVIPFLVMTVFLCHPVFGGKSVYENSSVAAKVAAYSLCGPSFEYPKQFQ